MFVINSNGVFDIFGALEAKSDLNDEHNTVTAPEQSGAAAFKGETKTCKGCLLELPITLFKRKTSIFGKKTSKCIKCRKAKSYATKRRWVKNNPDKVNAYARNYMLNYTHKNNPKYKPLAQKIAEKVARLESTHGPEYAAKVKDFCESRKQLRHHHRVIVRELLPEHLKKIGVNRLQRLIGVNRADGKPHWNIGWSCAICGEQNDDHRFFDVDHVIPKAKGGNNRVENLQVICPSCHRKKTISDGVLSVPASSELEASTPNRVDATSLINNPNPGKPGQCGEPDRLDSNLLTA